MGKWAGFDHLRRIVAVNSIGVRDLESRGHVVVVRQGWVDAQVVTIWEETGAYNHKTWR
jgi:hypothetical protein